MTQINVEWQENGLKHQRVVKAGKPVAIGRNPDCDIVLRDPYTSRQHAAIFYEKGEFRLHNLSKTNPIIFNERWVIPHNLRADLQPGDVIEIGRTRLWIGFSSASLNGSATKNGGAKVNGGQAANGHK